MCKSFIEIIDNKITRTKGKFKKGHWIACLECGIVKIQKGYLNTRNVEYILSLDPKQQKLIKKHQNKKREKK